MMITMPRNVVVVMRLSIATDQLVLPHGGQEDLEELPIAKVHVEHVAQLVQLAVEQHPPSYVVVGDGGTVGVQHGQVDVLDAAHQDADLLHAEGGQHESLQLRGQKRPCGLDQLSAAATQHVLKVEMMERRGGWIQRVARWWRLSIRGRPAVLHVILIGLHEQRDPASPNTGIYKCNRKRPMQFVSC